MPQLQLIERLEAKAAQLIADNRSLREQAVKLRQTAERLRAERMELQEKLTESSHRLHVLELGESMAGGGEQKRARARVNRLMREVDKCIALINSK